MSKRIFVKFLLPLPPLVSLFFFLHLYFCILSNFEIIRCIVKTLIAFSMYFLLKYNWKKKIWKVLFRWQKFLVYRSPNWPEYITGNIYSNYDIHLRATKDLLLFKWKWIRKICKYLCKYKLITEAAVNRYQNNCSTDFWKFPEKQPWWNPILVQLQAFLFS